MKKRTLLLAIAMMTITCLQAQETLKIDTSKSELNWFGYYIFHFGGHDGAISFKEGHFIKTDGMITGGEFIIDMNTITNNDIKNPKGNAGLVRHLGDQDFFDVENHPFAKLAITRTQYHDKTRLEVYANLTIKDVTLPIKFQAEVNYDTKQMIAKFKIDRLLWGISYQNNVRDGAVSDAIGFEAKLSL